VEILLYPFVYLSALGLVLSIIVHVAALLGLNVSSAAIMLHLGIFVVWLPAVITSNTSLKNQYGRKDVWKYILRGSPKWMRYMTFGFFYYAFINFAIFVFMPHTVAPDAGDMPPFVMRGFSGHWMAFYSAAFSILYSAIQIKKKNLIRRCPNGHEVSLQAEYCEECGQPISDTGTI